MQKDLFVCFPQWQGSGPSAELWDGAQALRRQLAAIPFQDVPVALEPPASVPGLFGFAAILDQQQAEHRLVEQARPDRIFSLGGDCAIELVPVSWLNRRYGGQLGVVWLDAHGDLNSPESSPSQLVHGIPLRFLLEEAPHPFSEVIFSRLRPAQVVLAGTRDLDPPESRFIRDSAMTVLGVEALRSDPAALSRHLLQRGLRDVYLHLDLDVLDPLSFPQVKCPTPGGLSLDTLRALIRSLKADCNLVGCSLLEYVHSRDPAGPRAVGELVHAAIGDWLPRS